MTAWRCYCPACQEHHWHEGTAHETWGFPKIRIGGHMRPVVLCAKCEASTQPERKDGDP